MLKQLCLQNFKSIAPPTQIDLRKLSVLCGSNSSGKSSIIQSILMLSQAFSSRYDFDTMVLNGPLVRLGAFKDILSHRATDQEILIAFKIAPPINIFGTNSPRLIEYSCSFGSKISTSPEDEYHPSIWRAQLKLTYDAEGTSRTEVLSIRQEPIFQPSRSNTISFYQVVDVDIQELENLKKEHPDLHVIGCESNSLIPTTLVTQYNHTKRIAAQYISLMAGKQISRISGRDNASDVRVPKAFFLKVRECILQHRQDIEKALKSSEELLKLIAQIGEDSARVKFWAQVIDANFPLNEASIPSGFFAENTSDVKQWLEFLSSMDDAPRKAFITILEKNRAELQTSWSDAVPEDLEETKFQLRTLSYVSQYLAQYFARSVKYLGPLRNEPKAVYTSEGHSDPKNVGLKGEYTAAALHVNRDRWLSYPAPVLDENDVFKTELIRGRLDMAAKEWLSYLGVIVDYETSDKGKLGYEIFVKTASSDAWQDLTHVGVGVSQVLPIVLMALLSEPGDLLIFEQPELHLHPKVQSRLCDFFCAFTEAGRQCVIETHSEYLINRLRLRIVQGSPESLTESSSVFFITKTDGDSKFDRVDINEYGAILDWPKEFFDQTDQEVERILIEASRKRRKEKEL